MKKKIIIAAAVVVVIAVGVVCYFKFFRKPSANDLTTTSGTKAVEQFEQATNNEQKNSKQSIVGLWAGANDNEFYYQFNDDGTGAYTMGIDIQTFQYKDNGDSVTIVFDGNTKEHVFKYTIKDNVLSIENDFGIIETYNWK